MREQIKTHGARPAAQQGTGLTFEQVKELVETFTQKALESGLAAQQQATDLQQQQALELRQELEAERQKVRALEQQLLEQQQKKRGLFRR
jgi:DNA-binding transcriptional MerR regulator